MTDSPAFSTPDEASRLAFAARKSGDIAGAVAIYHQWLKAFPSKENVAKVAMGLRACGNWSEAVTLLEESVKREPGSTGLVLGLADAYAEMKHFPRAIACVEAYLDRNPNDPKVWFSLGNLSVRAGDWSRAEQAFAQSLERQPLDIDTVLAHGDALYRLGRTDAAIAAYRRAAVLKPDDARGHFKLGSFLTSSSDHAEAKAALFRAIELDPSNAGAHASLAALYQRNGRLQRAVQAARQAIELDPELVAAYSILGNVLLEAGEFAGAVGILKIAADLAPGSVMVLTALAAAENAANNPRAAERVLQRILTIEPDNLEARHMLAAVNGEPVRSVPAGYSRQVFNWYAAKFDRMLGGSLKYRAPEHIAALLADVKPDQRSFTRFLDLGCGTGLVAIELDRKYAFERGVGVDIAEKMVEVSRQKDIYDEVIHGDAAEILAANTNAFDLITAVDLFTYVGDIGPLMPLIAGALAPGGILAYSIEQLPEGRYKLLRTGRFGHTQKYVEDLARAQGLVPLASRAVALRTENAADVPGLIGLLQRP